MLFQTNVIFGSEPCIVINDDFKNDLDYGTTNDKLILFTEGDCFDIYSYDPQTAALKLIKDSCQESSNTYFASRSDKFTVNNNLFFHALSHDGTMSPNLWKTDGTENGTIMLDGNIDSDFYINRNGDYHYGIIGNTVYYPTYYRDDAVLMKTDGTKTGTLPAISPPQPGYSGLNQIWRLTSTGATLFFLGEDGIHDLGLWKSDGTKAGTHRIKDIFGDYTYAHIMIEAYYPLGGDNNIFFFFNRYTNKISTNTLWRSDGTAQGTFPLISNEFNFVNDFEKFGNNLYIFVASKQQEWGLWKTDGTVNGTTPINISNLQIGSLAKINSHMYFLRASSNSDGLELWKTDGTPSGTGIVKKFPSGYIPMFFPKLFAFQSKIFFAMDDGIHGEELWQSDGTTSGTTLVKDIFPGDLGMSSYPSGFTTINDTLYFSARPNFDDRPIWAFKVNNTPPPPPPPPKTIPFGIFLLLE